MLSYLGDKIVGLTLAVLNALAPLEVHVDKDVPYAAGSEHRADIYRPAAGKPRPVAVFLYGGGWRTGSKDEVAYVGAAFARRGVVAVIPDYRHVPAATLQDILADNAAAVAWTIAHAAEYGGDPARVTVVGHSSGAWAAAMLGLDRTWLERAGSSPAKLAGIVGLAGPYATSALTDPQDRQVFVGSDPAMQPINHAADSHPAMLLATGAADLDVNPAGTLALDRELRGFDGRETMKIYPGLGHGQIVHAMSFPFSLRFSVADDVARFVKGARAGP
ncbi:alpha/beta hydrolase [Methylobacterium sp. NMS12]|uniref:alpha/beta hydrolase n=1 Tax=Methylobacterium sp. NMS12 TaxID=3079766 RepID=UPI003F880BBE